MSLNSTTKKEITMGDVSKHLKPLHDHTVECYLDEANCKLTVGRMEFILQGEDAIPGGWGGIICMVRKIGSMLPHKIHDSIVLRAITPGIPSSTGPYTVDVPNDIVNSKDEWRVEFYISDPHGKTECILRADVKRQKLTAAEIQMLEYQKKFETQLLEKDVVIVGLKDTIGSLQRENTDVRRRIDVLSDTVEQLKKDINDKTKELENVHQDKLSKEAEGYRIYNTLSEQKRKLDEDYSRLKEEVDRLGKAKEEERLKAENNENENKNLVIKLKANEILFEQRSKEFDDLGEKFRKVIDERDRTRRDIQELNSKIGVLEEELQISKPENQERERQLVEKITEARKLERELKYTKEILETYEKTIAQREKTISELHDELDSTQSTITQWQQKFEKVSTGQILFDNFEIIRHLASNDTGDMYKVCDRSLNRVVILKTLSNTIISNESKIGQVRLFAKLNHPNIIRVIEFPTNNSYILMEYVNGKTLRQILDTDAPFSLKRVIDYIKQICEGLSHVHHQNIVHGKLNPMHVMVTNEQAIKILGFGSDSSVRMITAMTYITSKMHTDMTHYLSPEQIVGERNIDGRADIYSVGIIFYEMLSGQMPFTSESVTEQRFMELPRQIQNVPLEINDILQKCLAKKPNERYKDVDELRRAFRSVSAITK